MRRYSDFVQSDDDEGEDEDESQRLLVFINFWKVAFQ